MQTPTFPRVREKKKKAGQTVAQSRDNMWNATGSNPLTDSLTLLLSLRSERPLKKLVCRVFYCENVYKKF